MWYRLGPGEMLSVNIRDGKLSLNDEVKTAVATKHPYGDWVKETIIDLPSHHSAKQGKRANFTSHSILIFSSLINDTHILPTFLSS